MRTRSPSPPMRALLGLLAAQPDEWQHGYELSRRLGIASGTLYPLLMRLHERGLLKAQWREAEGSGRPRRHVYQLSASGLAYACTQAEVPGGTMGEALA